MDAAFWLEKWQQGQTGFHAARPNALLVEHVGALRPGPTRRVYVPLCGKSLDLHFLRSAGFDEVIGTELSPLATAAFFAESGLVPEVREHAGWREFLVPADGAPTFEPSAHYVDSASARPAATEPNTTVAEARPALAALRIIEGDIFTLPAGAIPPCDAAYDRAALVAMDPSRRSAYLAHLDSVLRPGSPILLIAFSYDTARMSGPPFSVDAAVVHECFPPPATPRLLTSRELISSEPRFRDRGLTSIREECWVVAQP